MSRPEWSRGCAGQPIDTVVKLLPSTAAAAAAAAARPDVIAARCRVALVRPGALQPKPEDEFETSFSFGPETSNAQLHDRSVAPLVGKVVEGYNACIVAFGATGTGKTTLLEGGRAQRLMQQQQLQQQQHRTAGGGAGAAPDLSTSAAAGAAAAAGGDGLVNLAIDALFVMVRAKAVAVGEAVARRRRMPSARGFDYFVEASFVELYDERCHDLLAAPQSAGAAAVQQQQQQAAAAGMGRGAAAGRGGGGGGNSNGAATPSAAAAQPSAKPDLPLTEDVAEGTVVAGLTTRVARSAEELRALFAAGRASRDAAVMDLGSVHERSAAIFCVTLYQYAPAAAVGDEDRVLVSRLRFVDAPGAERLGADPELLRLREGATLNRGLLAFGRALRALAAAGPAEFVGHDDSLLTRLLSDALGGNCLTLLIGTLRQGDLAGSATTLRTLAAARACATFPVINHSRARGLLHKLRYRLLAVAVRVRIRGCAWGAVLGRVVVVSSSVWCCVCPLIFAGGVSTRPHTFFYLVGGGGLIEEREREKRNKHKIRGIVGCGRRCGGSCAPAAGGSGQWVIEEASTAA